MAHKRNSNRSTSISMEYRNLKGSKRERLIAERKRAGLTQTQLAKKLGCSTATISHLELGRVKPGLDISLGLESYFKRPFEILFPDL
ncbi:helix-turn-helix transcriptional regulator [Sporosarcina sp. FSL K6-3508]|uniref:helix-turn-helix transcriptional regulator n=1 Tax=Sporosarcina sp. FSL K6-3508 TaxID=2921557 RepID=UPI00315ABD6C